MLNWIKRTMLTSTCAAYNGGKLHPITNKQRTYMNDVTKVRIVYECSIIGIILLTFLKGMFPYMGAWWRVALIASLVGLWFSLSYLKQHNYKWGFNYIGNHLYINLLLKVQKWFQNATIIALLIPVFLKDLLYNQYCLVAYILLVGMFLGVKLATYTVEYAIYKSKFIGNKER